MARRAAYDRLLPFDRRFGFISDVDMWMRMCRSYDVAYVREPLIHLDDSPTAEREFDWKRIDALRRTQCANIERFYDGSPERYAVEMRRHRQLFRNWYLRNIATLALRGRPRYGVMTGINAHVSVNARLPDESRAAPQLRRRWHAEHASVWG